jgi:hypothetical protein
LANQLKDSRSYVAELEQTNEALSSQVYILQQQLQQQQSQQQSATDFSAEDSYGNGLAEAPAAEGSPVLRNDSDSPI